MKKFVVCSAICILFGAIFSCEKTKSMIDADAITMEDALAMRNYLLKYGFPEESIRETLTAFIVEDDIIFPKKDFWKNYKQTASSNDKKHYRYQNKVTAVTTVNVGVDNAVPVAWRTAIESAVNSWNALNGKIKFKYLGVINYCPANGITVSYLSLSDNNTFARGSFPTASGSPGFTLTINSTCTVTLTSAQKLKTAIHELGHNIGFMHTDVNPTDGSLITTATKSCNTGTDNASVMKQGQVAFTDFSACDKVAFKALYP